MESIKPKIFRLISAEYKQRLPTHDLEGLKDLPPVPAAHPLTPPAKVVERIPEISLANPSRGWVRISNYLKLQGISVSSPTLQNIIDKHGLACRYDCWLKLEEKHAALALELTGEQVAFIEKTEFGLQGKLPTRRAPLPGNLPGGYHKRGRSGH
ncbi:MAG: hypothetical protein ACUVXF_12050 [Desulfobaccales bacterium]